MLLKLTSVLFISIQLIFLTGCLEKKEFKPNIILLVIDSLPAGHLKSYGYHRLTSPTINQLAKESIVFENMYTVGGYSCPSFISILTSKHPLEHGFTKCQKGHKKEIPSTTLTIFDYFKSLSYRTGWFGPLKHNHINPDMGLKRSIGTVSGDLFKPRFWNTFSSFIKNKEPFFIYAHTYALHSPYLSKSKKKLHYAKDYSGKMPRNYDELTQSIAKDQNLHPSEVTNNMQRKEFWSRLDVNSPLDKKFLSDLFDDRLREFDSRLSLMINTLKSEKKWSNTILILTSDHGEIFGKKGSFTHNSLYEEVIHVPFIISHPKLKPKRISTIVSTLDIFPTIVSFIENKKDVVTGDKSVFNGDDRKRIITYHVRSESIIAWPWKLIRWRNGKDELYNLERDPTEKDDLSEESKLISEQLKFHLKSDKYKYFRSKTIL